VPAWAGRHSRSLSIRDLVTALPRLVGLSAVDATSFVLMHMLEVGSAFAFDQHCARAGQRLTDNRPSYNMCFNMELKLRKIGNSYGVILPGEVIEELQVREGGTLVLMPNQHGRGFQLTAENAEFETQMQVARSLMARYRETLRELAK